MRRAAHLAGLVFAAALLGCEDPDAFTTSPGECYAGEIVGADFVREGFPDGIRAYLTLDAANLARGLGDAGRVWTGDGRFDGAAVSQMKELAHDSLSLFQFPGGRVRNYMAHATAVDGAPAMLVISLMEDEGVELRVLRPPVAGAPELDPLFGVFRLDIDSRCSPPGGS